MGNTCYENWNWDVSSHLQNIHNLQTLVDWTFYFVIILLHLFTVSGPNKMTRAVMSLPGQWFKATGRQTACPLSPFPLRPSGPGMPPSHCPAQKSREAWGTLWEMWDWSASRIQGTLKRFHFFRTRHQPLSTFDITASYIFKKIQ